MFAALLATTAATACEPAPPLPVATFVVNDRGSGHDANIGDGLCEATPGAGDCTVQAAVDEATASPRGEVVLPALPDPVRDTYPAFDATITGHVVIRTEVNGSYPVSLWTATIRVDAGASLVLDGVALAAAGGALRVDGVVVASEFAMYGSVDIGTGGTLLGVNTALFGDPNSTARPTVINQGRLNLRYAFISGMRASAALHTAATGETTLGASVMSIETLPSYPPLPVCTGRPPVSEGYNLVTDLTCDLNGPHDLENADEAWRMDMVPVGAVGCGTTVLVDMVGRPRPIDRDGDGIVACDSGPGEYPSLAAGNDQADWAAARASSMLMAPS